MAALVVVCGGPASGKTATAQAIASGLREVGMNVVVVSEEGPPSVAYADPPAEKQTRGSLRSAVDRALSSSRPPPAVIVDGCNSVKGFRYELWCLGRSSRARYCCVFCPVPGTSGGTVHRPVPGSGIRDRDGGVDGAERGESSRVGRWPRSLFEDLASRVEPPDPRNRWECPLFVADATRPETGGQVGDGDVRPAPASLPAGGRGASIEEAKGWPLDSVAAAVVAAVGPASGNSNRDEQDGDRKTTTPGGGDDGVVGRYREPETLPLATTSIALRPAKCTLSARVAGADALGDLDAAAQAVLLAVAAAAKTTTKGVAPSVISSSTSSAPVSAAAATSTSDSAFAAIEIPLSASESPGARASGLGGEEQEPLTLSLRRAPSLAELRRHKRDFLRAATAPMAGPLPSGTRAGASAFCEYLKRRVI